jgi:hypothetical protein
MAYNRTTLKNSFIPGLRGEEINIRKQINIETSKIQNELNNLNSLKVNISDLNNAIDTKLSSGISAIPTPQLNNTYDIGTTSRKFKDLYLSGNVYVGTFNIGTTLTGFTLGSQSLVAGATSVQSLASGGAISGTTIGGTTITASSGFSGNITGNVTGNVSGNLNGNVTATTVSTSTLTANSVTIAGLDINNFAIAMSTALS